METPTLPAASRFPPLPFAERSRTGSLVPGRSITGCSFTECPLTERLLVTGCSVPGCSSMLIHCMPGHETLTHWKFTHWMPGSLYACSLYVLSRHARSWDANSPLDATVIAHRVLIAHWILYSSLDAIQLSGCYTAYWMIYSLLDAIQLTGQLSGCSSAHWTAQLMLLESALATVRRPVLMWSTKMRVLTPPYNDKNTCTFTQQTRRN